MATRLEIAQQKLYRLENELTTATNNAFSHMKSAHGSPVNDKRGGQSFMNKVTRNEDKCIRIYQEIKKQEERIEMLERQQHNKENGLTKSGGLATSVENIDRLKERIKEREDEIARGDVHRYSKQYLNKDKKKLQELEALKATAENKQNSMSPKAKQIIDDGLVTQWVKKPIYFFVKGLKKVALEIGDNGDFQISRRYPATAPTDIAFVENLLK